jgi:hypothetical protein
VRNLDALIGEAGRKYLKSDIDHASWRAEQISRSVELLFAHGFLIFVHRRMMR